MKIRFGFVSNSSSSSFVIVGREITVEEAEKLYQTSKIIVETGLYGSEGYYTLEIKTKEMMEVLKDAAEGKFNFTRQDKNYNNGEPYDVIFSEYVNFYEVFSGGINDNEVEEEGEFYFNPSDLPPINCVAIYLKVDQHTPRTANDLREYYLKQNRNIEDEE